MIFNSLMFYFILGTRVYRFYLFPFYGVRNVQKLGGLPLEPDFSQSIFSSFCEVLASFKSFSKILVLFNSKNVPGF